MYTTWWDSYSKLSGTLHCPKEDKPPETNELRYTTQQGEYIHPETITNNSN